jgi:hypothetical protein
MPFHNIWREDRIADEKKLRPLFSSLSFQGNPDPGQGFTIAPRPALGGLYIVIHEKLMWVRSESQCIDFIFLFI